MENSRLRCGILLYILMLYLPAEVRAVAQFEIDLRAETVGVSLLVVGIAVEVEEFVVGFTLSEDISHAKFRFPSVVRPPRCHTIGRTGPYELRTAEEIFLRRTEEAHRR